MKAKIGILSEELARKRMIRIAEGAEEPSPPFLFESLAVLSQLLSNENVELLNLIDREKPNSLDELAEKSGRSIKDVTDTFEALSSKGFAYIETKGGKSRPIALFTTFEIVMGSSPLL
ncbi:TPA: transcriptional regulator [Vibrio parahaemolyticus]|uniref:HVO_A0114 family putative DNA-binding protein n=1 Tax=Vibrio harveyi group TaxID=717610 RepID=UPI000428DFE3|nr:MULTISPECIES: transcriptional regulator [Vibrio harveyi group]EGQ8249296.1 transcriptional regulator [Vibrio parahaemolyticus]EGQ8928938.1 transcriptional regulator [Vibrio parahaemolyticus]EGQ8976261.1 transcriptional regulator [Vibrio parahaemolyticus]EGQ8980758.1 transcriptional regulator [Vibrio parahaemolyticus]EGQ9000078.1 transcriptional regulator [Vibrio parahaemolyticus]